MTVELGLDPFDLPVAPQFDHGPLAMPRVVEEERAVAPDRLELVALRQGGTAVELGEDIAGEAHRAREDQIGSSRSDELPAVYLLRLAGEET